MSKTNYYAKIKGKLSSLISSNELKSDPTKNVVLGVAAESALELRKRLDVLTEEHELLNAAYAKALSDVSKLELSDTAQKETIPKLFRYSCRNRTFVRDENGGYYTPWENWRRITKEEYHIGILSDDENGTIQYKFQGG